MKCLVHQLKKYIIKLMNLATYILSKRNIYTDIIKQLININNGIPYFEEILFKKKNKNLIEAYMKNEVKDIDGILNIMIIDSEEEESNNDFFNILRNFKKNVFIITNEE